MFICLIKLITSLKQTLNRPNACVVGGGRKLTRVEVTMNGGEDWYVATLEQEEKPNRYGKYWCWCFWSLDVEVLDLLAAKDIAVRAWDETQNTQPEKLIWNVMVCLLFLLFLLFSFIRNLCVAHIYLH